MWYLFWTVVVGVTLFGAGKLIGARRALEKVSEGALRAKLQTADPVSDAVSEAIRAILADLASAERISQQQADAWERLAPEAVEEQLLARSIITLEQWDQLWARHAMPRIKEAEARRTMITLDGELGDELSQRREKRKD